MQNVRFPAEWEPQLACWTAWPHLEKEWAENLEPARRAILDLCKRISAHEPVDLLVKPGDASVPADALGSDVRLHRAAFGDIWLRDTGPVMVWRDGKLEAVCFGFNGWGGKYQLPGDEQVGSYIARTIGCSINAVPEFVTEGGALESDGAGTIITTESCLLNPNRNTGYDRKKVEELLARTVGARKVIWLRDGLHNDHTDGHIDNLVRFVAPGTVICMVPNGKDDPNQLILEEIRELLGKATTADGARLKVIEVPSPGHIADSRGKPMPASYMNFIITNGVVAVPSYGVPADDTIVATLAGLFPTRNVVPIESKAVLSGGGSFHCITCHQPKNP